MKRNILAVIGLLGLGITIGIWLVANFSTDSGLNLFAQEKIGADNPPVMVSPNVMALNQAMIDASTAVLPTVVSIKVTIENNAKNNPFHQQWKEFFDFFDIPQGQPNSPHKQFASGSGVIISSNGYIITNNHVVDDATEISVTTHDRKIHKAKVIGKDPLTDLALIKIDANNLPLAHLANIDEVKVGEMVFAVGNPLGLNSTVTSGIVGAIGRGGLALPRQGKNAGYSVENFIQTDAAINPGNSGGGLFDIQGSLVGINSAIATRTGTYIGYGFAIPVDLVKSVISDLMEDGKVNRGYIGVRIGTVDETDAKAVGLDKVEGVMVHDVIKGGSAEKAGLEIGDVILEVDGKPVATSNELQSQIVLHRAGDKIKLTLWRNKKEIYKTVKLKARDEDLADKSENEDNEEESKSIHSENIDFDKIGFSVGPLTKEIKKSYDVKYGALITKVERYSQAEERRLAPNGVIIKADGKKVKTPEDLKKIIDSKKPGDGILLQLRYPDSNRIVALEIPEDNN